VGSVCAVCIIFGITLIKLYLLDISTIIAFSTENESLGSPAIFQFRIFMSEARTLWKLNTVEQGIFSSSM
jgi:hypothetical protein